MTICHDEPTQDRKRNPRRIGLLLRGAGGCSLIAIALCGSFAPTIGVEYTTSLQSAVAIIGAVVGVALTSR